MTEISCSGILFDLDGVLIDSTPAVARVWGWWAAQHGLNPEEVIRKAHGRPSIVTVREYVAESDAAMEDAKVEQAELEDLDGIVPLPGASELTNALPAKRWTIVTSGTRRLAEARIRASGLPMPEKIVTASDIVQGKPYPEPYLTGANLLGFLPQDCIVIEDAPAGVQAGKAAGARVLAVLTTALHRSELLQSGADWIAKDLSQIVLKASSDSSLRLEILNTI